MNEILEELGVGKTQFENKMAEYTIDTTELEKIEAEIYEFEKNPKFRGQEVPNPGNGKYYFHLNIDGRDFLQYIYPFIGGNVGLDDTNIDQAIKELKDSLIQNIVNNTKYRKALEYFKNNT